MLIVQVGQPCELLHFADLVNYALDYCLEDTSYQIGKIDIDSGICLNALLIAMLRM
jgi:hypothetical protein